MDSDDRGEASCRALWLVYLTCREWADRCPKPYLQWAWDDADRAFRNYEAAVERELEARFPDLRRKPWLI